MPLVAPLRLAWPQVSILALVHQTKLNSLHNPDCNSEGYHMRWFLAPTQSLTFTKSPVSYLGIQELGGGSANRVSHPTLS